MGRSHADKERRRSSRLNDLPSAEKALKYAQIKRKEGRILNSDERHALKMQSTVGEGLRLCEVVRCRTKTLEERSHAIDKVISLFREDWEKYCRSPQTSRVIQSCVKNGSIEQVKVCYELSISPWNALCSDPFAAYVVCSIVRHCSHAVFVEIVDAICQIGPMMIDSKPGIHVADTAFASDRCTARQRQEILCACLGPKEEMKRLEGYPSLPDMPTSLSPRLIERCDRMLVKANIEMDILHSLVLAGINMAAGDKEWQKEVYDALRPHVRKICLVSQAGSILAANVFAYLPPKERRTVLSELSNDWLAISGNKFGVAFLAAVIDHQLDAQVLYKHIVAEWVSAPAELLVPNIFRNFGKLALRLVTTDLKKKMGCVPEVWRRSYPVRNDEVTAKRHEAIAVRLLPVLGEAFMGLCGMEVLALPGAKVLLREIVHGPFVEQMPAGFVEWVGELLKRPKPEDEKGGDKEEEKKDEKGAKRRK